MVFKLWFFPQSNVYLHSKTIIQLFSKAAFPCVHNWDIPGQYLGHQFYIYDLLLQALRVEDCPRCLILSSLHQLYELAKEGGFLRATSLEVQEIPWFKL